MVYVFLLNEDETFTCGARLLHGIAHFSVVLLLVGMHGAKVCRLLHPQVGSLFIKSIIVRSIYVNVEQLLVVLCRP